MSEMKKLMEAIDSIESDHDVITKRVVGHKDSESRMMQRDLLKIRDYAEELIVKLEELPDGDFPHWWQAKLVKASDYLSTCRHFLDGEMRLGPRSKSGVYEEYHDDED